MPIILSLIHIYKGHIGTRDLIIKDLMTGGRTDFLITVEDKYDLLVGKESLLLHDLHTIDGNQDTALAVDDSQAIGSVPFNAHGVLFGVPAVEHCIGMGIENDLAIGVFRLQPCDQVDAIPLSLIHI